MYSDLTNKNNSAVGYRMRKWYNVLARIYWHRHAVIYYSLCVVSGKTSQHKHLCFDKLWCFKIPWWLPKPKLKKTYVWHWLKPNAPGFM